MRTCLIALALGCLPLASQTRGLPPEWEVRKDVAQMAERVARLTPLLEKTNPQDWSEQGAPAGYADQARRIRAEVVYIGTLLKTLARQPEKLTAALEAFFRLQALDQLMGSYISGVGKYQNPAVADLLQAATSEVGADREKLRQYVVDLAAAKEAEFKVVDQEAQRCRALLSRQPGAAKSAKKEEQR